MIGSRLLNVILIVALFNVVLSTAAFACNATAADGTCFGHALKAKYFLLGPGFCNLNHGSFGTVAKPVAQVQRNYFLEQESHPDTWFRVSYFNYIKNSRALLAKLINSTSDNVVLVENASSAVNSLLRSISFQRGDKVLRLSTAYGMVINTLNWLAEVIGIEVIVVNVDFPMEDESQLMSAVSQAYQQHPDIKLSIFSHISSMPAVVEPVKELTDLARKVNSLVLIDGAHAPGVLKIDIDSISPDFYLGNCHKWLFAPKGTAFLWVRKELQLSTFPEPTVISSSGKPDYIGRYEYTGTRDYTGFSSLSAAFDFVDILGGLDNIYSYNRQLAVEAGRFLSEAWGTQLLVPEELTGFMINVILPSFDADAIAYVQSTLDSEYDIYMVYSTVPDKTDPSKAIFFTRLSAQVYLELSDLTQLGELVPKLLKNYGTRDKINTKGTFEVAMMGIV